MTALARPQIRAARRPIRLRVPDDAISRFILTGFFLTAALRASAFEGDIDTTFGDAGVATLQPIDVPWLPSRPVVDANGRILVCHAGWLGDSPPYGGGFITRLTRDGALDATFGDHGRVALATNAATPGCALALQSDGRIIVLTSAVAPGNALPTRRLARLIGLAVDGSLDGSFGDAGIADFDVLPNDGSSASAIVVQADDAIVVAAAADPNRFYAARASRDGALDTAFGDGGLATLEFPSPSVPIESIGDVAIDSIGRIVIMGSVSTAPVGRRVFAAARFLGDGTPDSSFGDGGRVSVDFADRSAVALAGFIDAADRIVLAGGAATTWPPDTTPGNSDVAVARLRADGSLDPSFGDAGLRLVTIDRAVNGFDVAFGAAALRLGGVLLVGAASGEDADDALVLELDSSGQPRSTFGDGGAIRYAGIPAETFARHFLGVALQGSKPIVVGSATTIEMGSTRAFVVRLEGAAPRGHSAHARPTPRD